MKSSNLHRASKTECSPVGVRIAVFILAVVPAFDGCKPPANSVRAVHGNTDWHINTAHLFITCSGYDSSQADYDPVSNCVPATWTEKAHVHIGQTNTAHYYNDSLVATPGDDKDSAKGIDQLMLLFYAGHGSPTSWNTLGDSGQQTKMRLGNASNNGYLRYYWQCSCDVFAHGPKDGTCGMAGTFEYACPKEFDGSADSSAMRNVYERWGPVIADSALRMACGASTAAYCHSSQVNKIWDDYNNLGYGVADSFIDGLSGGGVVPLCIARGNSYSDNPLNDATFTTAKNNAKGNTYFLQYLYVINPPIWSEPAFPPKPWPIWKVDPPEPPALFRKIEMKKSGELQVAEGEALKELNAPLIESKDPIVRDSTATHVRIDSRSGAIYLIGHRKAGLEKVMLGEREYGEAAQRIVEAFGLTEDDVQSPVVQQMMIESRTADAIKGEQVQKNVIVTFRKRLYIGETPVEVLGEGGQIKVQLNNDGTLMNLAKVWRTTVGKIRDAEPVPLERAREQALRRTPKPDEYKVLRWHLGYREETGNVRQEEMKAIYVFELVPTDLQKRAELPPMLVEIPAQE